MCGTCIPFLESEREKVSQVSHNLLQTVHNLTTNYLNNLTTLEDKYRSAALRYHKTDHAIRTYSHLAPQVLDPLVNAFEIRTLTGYNALFAPATSLREDFQALEREMRFDGTVEEKQHRSMTLLTRFHSLSMQYRFFFERMENLARFAEFAFNVSERWVQENDFMRWFEGRGSGAGRPELLYMGEEWTGFVGWVSALPETVKEVGGRTGRSLEEVARGLLFFEGEGVLDLEEGEVMWLD